VCLNKVLPPLHPRISPLHLRRPSRIDWEIYSPSTTHHHRSPPPRRPPGILC
jgi:hypothetical protein